MSKQCRIYYGTVVNEDGGNWAIKGSHELEPIRVEGRSPFGREPEFCCAEFAKVWTTHYFSFHSVTGHEEPTVSFYPRYGSQQPMKITLCPFCGAQILCIEDLKLRAIKITVTRTIYNLEPA